MNELSRTVPMAFGALPPALAQLGASVAPVATSPTVTNSRRVVMGGLRSDGRCDRADGGDGRQGPQTCQARATCLVRATCLSLRSRTLEQKNHPDSRMAVMAPLSGRAARERATGPLPGVTDPDMGGQPVRQQEPEQARHLAGRDRAMRTRRWWRYSAPECRLACTSRREIGATGTPNWRRWHG